MCHADQTHNRASLPRTLPARNSEIIDELTPLFCLLHCYGCVSAVIFLGRRMRRPSTAWAWTWLTGLHKQLLMWTGHGFLQSLAQARNCCVRIADEPEWVQKSVPVASEEPLTWWLYKFVLSRLFSSRDCRHFHHMHVMHRSHPMLKQLRKFMVYEKI